MLIPVVVDVLLDGRPYRQDLSCYPVEKLIPMNGMFLTVNSSIYFLHSINHNN